MEYFFDRFIGNPPASDSLMVNPFSDTSDPEITTSFTSTNPKRLPILSRFRLSIWFLVVVAKVWTDESLSMFFVARKRGELQNLWLKSSRNCRKLDVFSQSVDRAWIASGDGMLTIEIDKMDNWTMLNHLTFRPLSWCNGFGNWTPSEQGKGSTRSRMRA